MAVINPPRIEILDEGVSQGRVTRVDYTGAGVTATVSGELATVAVSGGGGGSSTFTAFTKDLGVARRSGTFDITGLSGLTAAKDVQVWQTGAKITSKGDARDEPEMDQIRLTGYVVDAATIRVYWYANSVVVGTYAFAYLVGA
jgi:hypothetical protein